MTGAPSSVFNVAYEIIEKVVGSGPAVLTHASTLPAEARGTFLVQAAQHFLSLHDERDRYALLPVDIQTFVEGEGFLNSRGVLYPAVMKELQDLNSGKYDEAVLTGAIGTGKSTIALFTTAYQLYVLSCLKDPHQLYSLDPASEIVFAFQSLNKMLAELIDYKRFRTMIEGSAYFAHHFPFRRSLGSEMVFPKNIVVRPLSGNVNAAIGSNIFGGIIDELNQLHGSRRAVEERSRRREIRPGE